MFPRSLQRFSRDILAAVRRDKFDHLADGSILIAGAMRFDNWYVEGIKGDDGSFRRHHNLVPDAALLSILNVYFGAATQIPVWYLAPYSGNVAPAAGWTGANFAANATEITSTSQGYSESTRQQWTPAAAAAGKITNTASKANFTIVCTSTINIYGAGLLQSSTRGGTTGVLASATLFGTVRVANNGDIWQCGYEATLADS